MRIISVAHVRVSSDSAIVESLAYTPRSGGYRYQIVDLQSFPRPYNHCEDDNPWRQFAETGRWLRPCMRVSLEERQLFERAARKRGQTLADFMRDAMTSKALMALDAN